MSPAWLILPFLQATSPTIGGVARLLHQPDSGETLGAARRAQAQFESTRRQRLPYQFGHSGGDCDVRIGHFCYWYSGEQEDSVPEGPGIRDARRKLLGTLAEAARALPGDEWIAGQRVRYLVEDDRATEAVTVARECRASGWWCAALAGLALHEAGEFAPADSAFGAALSGMPDDERCRWHDVSMLLPDDLRRRHSRLSCEERAVFEARFWWLAAPLLSRPGNDRRTEHFARLTMSRIGRYSHTVYDTRWDDDQLELVVRFGWAFAWARESPRSLASTTTPIVGFERTPAWHFVPSSRALDDPRSASEEDWALNLPRAPERYAPSYATRFARLDPQVSTFRRGDSCTVVAAYDLSDDSVLAHRSARAALVLSRSERDLVVAGHEIRLDEPDVLVATAPCGPQLLSLEVVAPATRRVARARFGIALDEHAAISDLLLLEGTDSLPADLASALPHALATTRVHADRPLGLFWEVPGLSPDGEEVTTSLTVTRRGTGWLRRAIESVGLAAPRREVSLEWVEVLQPRADNPTVASRALAVDLASISPGPYRIEVTVTARGRASVTVMRDIELVRP